MANGFALLTEILPSRVVSAVKLDEAAPSLQSHYRTFSTTTGCSVPVSRIGTHTLMGAAHLRGSLGIGTTGSPVPHSSLDPGHATCMPDADGIVSRLRPDCSQRSLNSPVLTSSVFAFDTSSVVRLCSSPWIHTCPVFPGLFLTRSRHRLLTDAAGGGLVPAPASRYRGTYPHLECSTKHSPSSACSRHKQGANFWMRWLNTSAT